jgi:hypothetical protein
VGRLSYIQLHGLIDSDWAGSADNKRSDSWICFNLIFSTISWARRKQKSVTLSTVEGEYIVACDACTEVVMLCKVIPRLFDQVLNLTMMYCDNHRYVKLT